MTILNLFGYAPSYVAVIMDVCNDVFGVRNFRIHKNIAVDALPNLPFNQDFYHISFVEPQDELSPFTDPVAFGLSGPWGKYCVFNDFLTKYSVTCSDYLNIIHPTAYVASSARMDTGIVVEPGVAISSQSHICFGVDLKRGASVGHHCVIGEYTEVNPGVIISGNVSIGKGCILGTGAAIKDGIRIGKNSIIGMGSVVTRDIPPGVIAFGNPCKVVRDNDKYTLPA